MIEIDGLMLFTNVYQVLLDLKSHLYENEISLLDDIKYSDGAKDIMVTCPFHAGGHEKNPSCGVSSRKIIRNKKTYDIGTVNCFTCGYHASLFEFVANCMGSNNIQNGRRWLVQKYNSMSNEARPKMELSFSRDVKKSKQYEYMDESELDKYRYTNSYLYDRGFDDNTIEFFEFGYNKFNHTITLPVRDHYGGLVFVKQRFITPPPGMDKYLNTPGIPKQYIIYGFYHVLQLLQAIKDGTCNNVALANNFKKFGIAITEGEFNAAYLWQNNVPAVSLLGRILFEDRSHKIIRQKELLLRHGIHSCILWMDNDEYGQEAQKKIKKQLNTIRVYQPDYLQFPQYNDANDFPPEAIADLNFTLI